MTRLLVLMGSGETTPTMVETHKRLLSAVQGEAVLVDTPYGFQENADDLTARTRAYFARSVEASIDAVELRDVERAGAARVEAAIERIDVAGWVFTGPGSPSYLLRQWAQTRLPDVFRDRLGRNGVQVFASAGACTVGRRAVPVYEIYKVGQPPTWIDGLDLLRAIDLQAVVVPHWDNAEGGTHDTRFCYLGQRRLEAMEADLSDDLGILGVDEHTAAILDLDRDELRIEGRGGVVARHRGVERRWESGATVPLAEVRAAVVGLDPDAAHGAAFVAPDTGAPEAEATPFGAQLADLTATFRARLERGEAVDAAEAVLGLADLLTDWAADPNQSDEVARARAALQQTIAALARAAEAGMHDHRDLVAPHVERLLDLRAEARKARDFATADQIRDTLVAGGIEVRDTPEGADWEFEDPTL